MFKKVGLSTLLAATLLTSIAWAQATDPNLVGWWTLDDEGTGMAMDHSGNGRNGTLIGDAQFTPDGLADGAVVFDGAGDRVDIAGYTGVTGTQSRTCCAWIKNAAGTDGEILNWGANVAGQKWIFRTQTSNGTAGAIRVEVNGGYIVGSTDLRDDAWHHVAAVLVDDGSPDVSEIKLYVDGELENNSAQATEPINTASSSVVRIGQAAWGTRPFTGLIDEARIYDRALSAEEIEALAARPKSYTPSPANDAALQEDFVLLTWVPGGYAAEHDVYVSHDRDAVALGAPEAHQGRQESAFLYLTSLDLGDYYYWRVDDVEVDGVTIHRGDVWRFLVPDRTAYWPDPADGVEEYADPNLTLSWGAGMGSIIHNLYLGENFDDVNEGTPDTNKGMQPLTSYTPGALKADTTYYWRVDETDPTMTVNKGPVWSFKTRPDVAIDDPNLVAWWTFDEGTGSYVVDWSGHNHGGVLTDDPQWVPGYDGGALEFDGRGDAVEMVGYAGVTGTQSRSVCAWIKTAGIGEILSWGQNVAGQKWIFRVQSDNGNAGTIRVEVNGGYQIGSIDVRDDRWHHVAAVLIDDGSPDVMEIRLYIDGWLEVYSAQLDEPINTASGTVLLGNGRWQDRPFTGLIDDVRLYDKALTQEEVKQAMRGDLNRAWEPTPKNLGTPDILAAGAIGWSPGDMASQHDVYFGPDPNAVRDADTTSPEYMRRQSGTTYPLAGLVELGGGPYYWRIDEINTDATVTEGRVWTFSVSGYLTIDDFEDYNNTDPYRVFDTWLDGTVRTDLGGSQVGYWLEQADLDAGENFLEDGIVHSGAWSTPLFYANDGLTKYSEVKLTLVGDIRDWTQHGVNTLSLWTRGYPPVLGSFTAGPGGTYTMVASGNNIGDQADGMHFAYKMLTGEGSIIAKVEALAEMNAETKVGVMIRNTLDAGSLNAFAMVRPTTSDNVRLQYRDGQPDGLPDSTSNMQLTAAETVPRWLKLERNFSGSLTAYHANDVGGAPDAWELIDTGTGPINIQMDTPMYIGLALTSHVVDTPAAAVFSNVSTTGSVTGNWEHQDIGIRTNDIQPLYVAIQNTAGQPAVVENPDIEILQENTWTEWVIQLSDFENKGIDLADVNSITLGLGTKGGQSQPGDGLIFVDDIRLYPSRCFADIVKPTADLSDNCVVDMADLEILSDHWLASGYEVTATTVTDANLIVQYQFEGNAMDSSGNGYHGTVVGNPTYVAGSLGQAMSFDGMFDYVVAIDDANLAAGTDFTEITVAAWIRTESGENQCIASADRDAYWRLEISGNGAGEGQVGFDVATYGGVSDFGSKTRVDDGQWHHVAGVFDAGEQRIYIDGLVDAETHVAGTFGTGELRRILVAQRSEGVDGYNLPQWTFQGDMDDFRLYDRALPHAEIANLAGITVGEKLAQPLFGLFSTTSDADLVDDEQIDFKDYAALIDAWTDEQLWP